MKKYQEKIYNVQTGETTYRDWTPEEIAEAEAKQAQIELELAEQAAKEAARLAVLEKLGLSAEDIAALGL
jgi:hypothetical protein